MIVPEERYMRIDPRQIKQFMRMPGFAQSLSPAQSTGLNRRVLTARWNPNERIVYAAVQEGYTDLSSLPLATGLTTEQIDAALGSLTAIGAISVVK